MESAQASTGITLKLGIITDQSLGVSGDNESQQPALKARPHWAQVHPLLEPNQWPWTQLTPPSPIPHAPTPTAKVSFWLGSQFSGD